MSRRHAARALLGLFLLVAVAACESGSVRSTRTGSRSSRPAAPTVYVALGGEETLGATVGVQLRDVWPQVLYRRALPKEAVFYNLAREGGLTADAIPAVLALVDELKPTLVTLWSNSADEPLVGDLVRRLRRDGGTRVLVAGTNDTVRRAAEAEGATVVDVTGSPVSAQDHRAVASAFAQGLHGARR